MYDAAKVRELNDTFRRTLVGGRVVATRGVLTLPNMIAILNRVRDFSDFHEDNDPYGEHEFGAIEHQGVLVFFKIDYYDLDMRQGSPDPADRSVTTRVMTVMLADEY